jgi:predicted Zn-dependent protease
MICDGLVLLSIAVAAAGQSASAPGPIAPRDAADLHQLIQIEQRPDLSPPLILPDVHGKTPKIPTKYDVSRIGERGVEKGVNFYSTEQEQALGKEMAKEIESACKMLDDPVVTAYVDQLGQRLVRFSDAKIPFTIKVLDSDEVNAFALPGGYFYVNSGLIVAAHTEAELAGVMAHEIAHVAARHATRGATRTQIWNLASIPLVFVGGPVGLAIREVSSIALPMTFMKFSRGFEQEADVLGIEYEYAAGYDPEAFVDFFERLGVERKKPNFMARAFATHPMGKDRVRKAQKEIETMLPAHDQYLVNTSEFDEIRARLLARIDAKLKSNADVNPNKPVLHRRDHEQQGSGESQDGPKLNRR